MYKDINSAKNGGSGSFAAVVGGCGDGGGAKVKAVRKKGKQKSRFGAPSIVCGSASLSVVRWRLTELVPGEERRIVAQRLERQLTDGFV